MSHRSFIIFLIPILGIFLSCGQINEPSEDELTQYVDAMIFYQQGNLEKGEEVLLELVNENKNFLQAQLLLGRVYYFQEDLGGAERVLLEVLKMEKNHPEALLWISKIYIQQGRYDEAHDFLVKGLQRDSEDPRLLFLMAQVTQQKGNLDQALGYFQALQQYEEELALAHLHQGELFLEWEEPIKAMAHIERAVQILPQESPMFRPTVQLYRELQAQGEDAR